MGKKGLINEWNHKDMDISKTFKYSKPLNFIFLGVIISFICFGLFLVKIHMGEIRNAYHDLNSSFSHNIARNNIEKELLSTEFALINLSKLIASESELWVAKNNRPYIANKLSNLLGMIPSVNSVIFASNDGDYVESPFMENVNDNIEPEIVKAQPWFITSPKTYSYTSYTNLYKEYTTDDLVVRVSSPVFDTAGALRGTVSFSFDFSWMGNSLRQQRSAMNGSFYVVSRNGQALIHPDPSKYEKNIISDEIVSQMSNDNGFVYDAQNDNYHYYYSYTHPDWFFIYTVSGATLEKKVWEESKGNVYGLSVSIIVILFVWFLVKSWANALLIKVANGIENGTLDISADKMLSNKISNNRKTIRSLEKTSLFDTLTGVRNRRAFDKTIDSLMESGQPFYLALLDIDDFKQVNDTYGHGTGDIVLKIFSQDGLLTINEKVGQVFRYGGEEFAVLFNTNDLTTITTVLNNWRISIEQRNWREEQLKVTFSAGLGQWRNGTKDELIDRVDSALYEAKRNGKNQIKIS